MKISFELTMPNNNSWNGKWSGADKKYYVIKSFSHKSLKDKINDLLNGKPKRSFYYNFGDGWGANVEMEIVSVSEANKRSKISAGFCGYEWMVSSILTHGLIKVDEPVNDFQ